MFEFERLKYINHLGQVIDFGVEGFYVNANDLRDYEWEVKTKGDKITGFKRVMTSKTLPVVVFSESEQDAINKKNRLFEEVEKDVLANQAGKIVIGDYYYKCFVVESSKAKYVKDKRFAKFGLGLVSDEPYWVKESKHSFRKIEADDEDNLDYPYDFPYDYYSGGSAQRLVNTYFAPVGFKMVIYGAVNNPSITIGGHSYGVNVVVGSGEYLTVDSTNKTIVLTKNNGEKVNKYDDRNRASYIFEPIPAGSSTVSWVGSFKFDITLLEERSEPKWT